MKAHYNCCFDDPLAQLIPGGISCARCETATWDDGYVLVAKKGESSTMAQSKKDLLKSIRRQFAEVGRTLKYAPCDIAILECHRQLRLDIGETLQKFQGVSSVDLWNVASPVTFQHLDQLRMR